MYARRYPARTDSFRVVANGYDERYFAGLDDVRRTKKRANDAPVTLLHSGVIYPFERDPSHFLAALRVLKDEAMSDRLHVILRASGMERELAEKIAALDIGAMVSLEGGIEYRDALREMVEVDGLLVLQATNCNHQIPAKIYEYIRSGTPIVALTDPQGDTAGILAEVENSLLAPLDDTQAIHDLLVAFVQRIETGAGVGAPVADATKFSRKNHAIAFEEIVEHALGTPANTPCD
jgi:glycosyltransferase involved in cell wall biosynthesis